MSNSVKRNTHALACALLLLAGATTAFAFPFPYPAQLAVSPWIPTPTQHVIVTVSDTWRGVAGGTGGSALQSVQSTVTGNTITITAKLAYDSGSSEIATFPVDLGTLPAGRYTVQYASGPTWNQASMSFSVANDGLTSAIEFFNSTLGHYFVTADQSEIAKLDQGTMPGWARTGETFKVMVGAATPTTALPVCRFYGLPSAGLDSHFFSASATECAAVQERWPTQWLLETTNAFGIAYEGWFVCPSGSRPLYRLYNNRPDANHRYTTSPATRDLMLGQGWILEGTAPNNTSNDLVAMCVPTEDTNAVTEFSSGITGVATPLHYRHWS